MAAARCVAASEDLDLIVGRPEAVYFYEASGRGPCLAFPGEKRQLNTFRGHLLVISATTSGAGDTSQLHVYDLRHKLIAYVTFGGGEGSAVGGLVPNPDLGFKP